MMGRICVLGEVLFDHFPSGERVLGGAPFNVAWHLQAFSQAPYFVSRVGDDREGGLVRAAMREWGMDTGGLQTDPSLPTGSVLVQLDGGEPTYDIVEPSAYDAIESPAVDVGGFDLLYHGTLALRAPETRRTAAELRSRGVRNVFVDVNLRAPHWERDFVLQVIRDAHWVKLNIDELALLHSSAGNATSRAADFLTGYDLEGVILTRGSSGAQVLTAGGARETVRPEGVVEVVDTVGAGDAFASVMILGLANGWEPGVSLQRAQAFASALVGRRGATVADRGFYRAFAEAWKLQS